MSKEITNSLPMGTVLHGQTYDYEVGKVLGQGSFGITYLAKVVLRGQLGAIGSSACVAIKEFFMKDLNGRVGTSVMTGGNTDLYQKYRKDFIREATNLSRLQHPHIVKVLESFEANDTAYFVMEYIEGGNLNDCILAGDGMSEMDALRSIAQVAAALSCMHDNKVLHLDIKPLNIMRRDNGDMVLIDFGLSKQFNSDGEPESSTRIGGGTAGYAPLEQANYKKNDGFCPTMDIYALGATLYKMLSGLTPPDASAVFNDGFPESALVSKGVSRDIIDLISWAMEPMRRKRPQTVVEFLDEVNRILPQVSAVRKNDANAKRDQSAEPTIPFYEVCNGFQIHWSNDVTNLQKDKIRKLLDSMQKIGESRFTGPIMSSGGCNWNDLYPLISDESTSGLFPLPSVGLALTVIHSLACWTGLPFRLPNEDEMWYECSAHPLFWDSLKALCYSKANRLQYHTFGEKNYRLNDIRTVAEWNMSEPLIRYDIHLVCDGLKPIYHYLPYARLSADEIRPIGFGLYKVREGQGWNVKSPQSPKVSYLPDDYESISSINVWHVPGGGPRSGCDYIGIVAQKNGLNYYYEFKDGKFRSMETLSEDQIRDRDMWT